MEYSSLIYSSLIYYYYNYYKYSACIYTYVCVYAYIFMYSADILLYSFEIIFIAANSNCYL